ncbi:MAG: hypothetical protein JXA71_15460 [Chitinispirillaceae bacterium]|nr:hypothetical protein [Chitinispirillaceae bacterium]
MKNGYRLDEIRQMTEEEAESRVAVLINSRSDSGNVTVRKRQVLRNK